MQFPIAKITNCNLVRGIPKIIEIALHFSDERSFYMFLTPITCLDHIPIGLLLFGPSRYKFTVKIGALACSVLEIYTVIDCVHHSSFGAL